MAVISPTITKPGQSNNDAGPAVLWVWDALTAADTAEAVEIPLTLPDRTVVISGTFGGATVVVEGSLDNTVFFGLTDPQGNAISKTTAGGEALLELVRYIRPAATGGIGQTLKVTLLASGPRR